MTSFFKLISRPMTSSNPPILYSFRRCPYAMRARLALAGSGVAIELREIVLRDKPAEMLAVSPKGTVPVLQLPDGSVIDESLDIIYWALAQSDPHNWLGSDSGALAMQAKGLIATNDQQFKAALDRYKYYDRFPEYSQAHYRSAGELFIRQLEGRLSDHDYLLGARCSLADIAIFPFIRQFAHVDREWFFSADYPALQGWLNRFTDSDLFSSIMYKYSPWRAGDRPPCFPYSA